MTFRTGQEYLKAAGITPYVLQKEPTSFKDKVALLEAQSKETWQGRIVRSIIAAVDDNHRIFETTMFVSPSRMRVTPEVAMRIYERASIFFSDALYVDTSPMYIPEGVIPGTVGPLLSPATLRNFERIFIDHRPDLEETIVDVSVGGKRLDVSVQLPYGQMIELVRMHCPDRTYVVPFEETFL